jgi:HPr kinase/phosphorylase
VARTLTARSLFDELEQRLHLKWVAGLRHDQTLAITDSDLSARPALAGYLNLIHPNRIQVLGPEELRYLEALDTEMRETTLCRIFSGEALAVIVGDDQVINKDVIQHAEASSTPLFLSSLATHELVGFLQYYVSRTLARRVTLHGVFLEVFTMGVLITGDAGSGKSELALELLNRGHRLIADDAPEFTQISPEIIDGTCPQALQDCLEVRGLGILNIRRMFGDAAIKLNKFLRLIIHLEVPGNGPLVGTEDRLHGDTDTHRVLDLDIPRITLPVLAGRNLAVIAEAAVRDFMLKLKGFDAATDFIERHSRLLQHNRDEWEK